MEETSEQVNERENVQLDSVHVYVRIRPFISREQEEHQQDCIRCTPSNDSTPTQLVIGKDRAFTFDGVFQQSTQQQEIYDVAVQNLVQSCFEGYNATVFAYGQTGSGKTFTMTGNESTTETRGIIPRVVDHLFTTMDERKEDTQFMLQVEYLEIYNEEIRDLLHPEVPSKQISIRENSKGLIAVRGVKSEIAHEQRDVYRLIEMGSACRSTGSTMMNEHSSRSHAILTLILQQNHSNGEYTKSKFHLVDLAGSERAKRTQASGQRFKEAVNINQGLLALGNVISALADEKRKATHIPYRESKLTRMLQDSLGGNSRTLMLACVSPSSSSFAETLNTLKYANRAKNIKNRPTVNHGDEDEDEKAQMRNELETLRIELEKAQGAAQTPPPEDSQELIDAQQRLQELEQSTQDHLLQQKELRRILKQVHSSVYQASTTVVALENDTSLGRPLRRRIHEIYSLLKDPLETSAKVLKAKRLSIDGSIVMKSVVKGESDNSPRVEVDTAEIASLQERVDQLEDDLARDEEIFANKNQTIEELEGIILDAKSKNAQLLQRVQELENTQQGHRESPQEASPPEALFRRVNLAEQNGDDDDNVLMQSMNLRESIAVEETTRKQLQTQEKENEATDAAARQEICKLERTARDLEVNIKLKEELIHTMVKNEKKTENTMLEQEKRITDLVEQISQAQRQLEKAEQAREAHEARSHEREAALGQWKEERQAYEAQIKAFEARVDGLAQEKQQAERLLEVKQKSERKIECLNQELRRMRSEKETIAKTIEKDRKQYRMEMEARQRELNKQKKEAEDLNRKVRDLERNNERQRRLLEQHKAKRIVERPTRAQSAGVTRKKVSLKEKPSQPSKSDPERLKKFEELLDKGLHSTALAGEINYLVAKHNETLARKQEISKRKSNLEMKQLRQSMSEDKGNNNDKSSDKNKTITMPLTLQQEWDDIQDQLDALNEQSEFEVSQIEEQRVQLEKLGFPLQKDTQEAKGRDSSDQPVSVKFLGQAIVDRLGPLRPGDTGEILRSCCNQMIALNKEAQSNKSLVQELKMQLNENQQMVREMGVGMKAAKLEYDRRLTAQKHESELELQALLNQLESTKEKAPEQIPRERPHTSAALRPPSRIDLLEKDERYSSRDLDKLLTHGLRPSSAASTSSEQASNQLDERSQLMQQKHLTTLVKHVMYYKSKSAELKKQLAHVTNAALESGAHDEAVGRRIEQLEKSNDKLSKELINLKTFLKQSSSAPNATADTSTPSQSNYRRAPQPVRIPKSALREVAQPSQL